MSCLWKLQTTVLCLSFWNTQSVTPSGLPQTYFIVPPVHETTHSTNPCPQLPAASCLTVTHQMTLSTFTILTFQLSALTFELIPHFISYNSSGNLTLFWLLNWHFCSCQFYSFKWCFGYFQSFSSFAAVGPWASRWMNSRTSPQLSGSHLKPV